MIKQILFIEVGSTQSYKKIVHADSPWQKIQFPATVCVIEHSKLGVILFDTGYSPRFHEYTKFFPEKIYALLTPVIIESKLTAAAKLDNMGIKAHDVKYVFLSHFHADHIGGAKDFPNAIFIYAQDSLSILNETNRLKRLLHGFLPSLLPDDFKARSTVLENSALIKTDILGDFSNVWDVFSDASIFAVPLPGHSAGHTGLFFECQGKSWFLVGDAVWLTKNLDSGVGPTTFAFAIMHSKHQYQKTLRNLKELYSKKSNSINFIPCHCQETMHKIGINSIAKHDF